MASAPGWSFELRRETRAVLAHGLSDGSSDGSSCSQPLSDAAWAAVRAESSRHRLDGLLIAAVASGDLAVSPGQRAEVAQLEVDLTLVRMWQETRFPVVVEVLEHAGIDVVVLKGPALGRLDYADVQLRPTSDLDLLIRGDQLDRACEVLVSGGAARTERDPTPGYAAVVGKGVPLAFGDGLEVDLHRTLVWGPFGVRIVTDDLWSDTRPFEMAGTTLRALSVEASLLHACYHLLVLGSRRALSARDVAQLLASPDLDAARALWLSRRWNGEAVLAAGIQLAIGDLALDGDSLISQWAAGYPSTLRERVWLRAGRPDAAIGPLVQITTFLALRTAEERAVLRRAALHPEPGTLAPIGTRARRVARRLIRSVTRQSR